MSGRRLGGKVDRAGHLVSSDLTARANLLERGVSARLSGKCESGRIAGEAAARIADRHPLQTRAQDDEGHCYRQCPFLKEQESAGGTEALPC